ncbi:hypothetical protein [Roseibium sp. SCP14]|uniref:hypothetical protein n=1 Tax=Roseibium sp. SCP14 TaxID=3141375 RepID=UPI0033386977
MRTISKSLAGAVVAFGLLASPVLSADVQNQETLAARVSEHSPAKEPYIKDRPILGWTLSGDSLQDIPGPIRDVLGSTDATKYDDAYVAANKGSIVALQMRKDGPDFYIIGKETFDGKYTVVALEEVAAKNSRLMERLIPEVKAMYDAKTEGLVGALKTVPVEMIRTSAIGYSNDAPLTIQAPWGEQTKPEGQDAFLVWDTGENQYYMVNQDETGLPISYIPAN